MVHLKSIAISICAATLMFGIIKNILPGAGYQKYMRLILTLIFLILTINGIREVVFNGNIDLEGIQVDTANVSVEDQLSLQIKAYLNDQLKNFVYEAECRDVMIKSQEGNYYISEIYVASESDEVIGILKEITGLQEEQIHVGT